MEEGKEKSGWWAAVLVICSSAERKSSNKQRASSLVLPFTSAHLACKIIACNFSILQLDHMTPCPFAQHLTPPPDCPAEGWDGSPLNISARGFYGGCLRYFLSAGKTNPSNSQRNSLSPHYFICNAIFPFLEMQREEILWTFKGVFEVLFFFFELCFF